MPLPRITTTTALLGMLVVLLLGSVITNFHSLKFCEQALYGEMETLRKEGTVKEAVKFTDVCPEVRQKVEANTNKLLEIILALLVPVAPHPPGNP
jgi:hypothetical protein